jgi:two-component system, NtrC family, response regulator GlrR
MQDPDRQDEQATDIQSPPQNYEPGALRHGVQVRWTDAKGKHSVTLDGRAIVGSSWGSTIAVDDPAVSRVHAEFDPRPDGLWIRDLGSRNGTFIEGIQVALGRVPEGAGVRVGSTILAVRRETTPRLVELWPHDRFGPLLGGSLPMRELFARLHRVAPTESTILIYGETGTGKELVARAIHEASPRAQQPYVVVDCAGLPESLLESELFGHVKGAFTGATANRTGAIEAAEGGTVFLDEVGELPLSVQPKLLRVLESRTVRRIGETTHRNVNVRFISATHRDLRTMINEGTFREDLYFRLGVIPIVVPPLRERTDDVELLIASFAPPGSAAALGPEVVAEAAQRSWPGNVRELRNFVERVIALGAHEAISLSAPGEDLGRAAGGPWKSLEESHALPLREARAAWLDILERDYLRRLLARHDNNVPRAAQAAGIDRTHLYRLIRKHER